MKKMNLRFFRFLRFSQKFLFFPKVLLILCVLLVTVFVESVFLRVFLADVYFKNSQNSLAEGQYENALYWGERALEKNPSEPFYYRARARSLISLSVTENDINKQALKKLALNDLQKSLNLNTKNLRTIRDLIPLYYLLTIKNFYVSPQNIEADSGYAFITRDFYAWVKTTYPNDAGVLISIAEYEKKLGWADDYDKTVEMIRVLRPDLLEWRI